MCDHFQSLYLIFPLICQINIEPIFCTYRKYVKWDGQICRWLMKKIHTYNLFFLSLTYQISLFYPNCWCSYRNKFRNMKWWCLTRKRKGSTCTIESPQKGYILQHNLSACYASTRIQIFKFTLVNMICFLVAMKSLFHFPV